MEATMKAILELLTPGKGDATERGAVRATSAMEERMAPVAAGAARTSREAPGEEARPRGGMQTARATSGAGAGEAATHGGICHAIATAKDTTRSSLGGDVGEADAGGADNGDRQDRWWRHNEGCNPALWPTSG